METSQKFLNGSGKETDQSTVKLGSGASPSYTGMKNLKLLFVTKVLPSMPIPPIASVTQVGSPEKDHYILVFLRRTILSFITN